MKSGGRGGGGAEGGCREGGEREDGGASDALARAISARLRHLRATRRTGGNTDNGHGNTGNGHAPSDDVSNDALPPPGPGSIVVSNDRWCVYPPALGKPNRKTDNPPVHLDICPWTYVSTGIYFSYEATSTTRLYSIYFSYQYQTI